MAMPYVIMCCMAPSRAAEMRRRRAYSRGAPIRQSPCNPRFGLHVARALGDAKIGPEALAQAIRNRYGEGRGLMGIGDTSRQMIAAIATGSRGASPQKAWMIGQVLRDVGVSCSSGLSALAAAGYDEQLLGILGSLISRGADSGSGSTDCLRKNWHVLEAAPFEDMFYTILYPCNFALDHFSTYSSRYLAILETLTEKDLENTARLYDAIYDLESRKEKAQRDYDRLWDLYNSMDEYLRSPARLSRVEIDDEFAAECDIAWNEWSDGNYRGHMPQPFRRAINALDQRDDYIDPYSPHEAWVFIADQFFARVNSIGFDNAAHLFEQYP